MFNPRFINPPKKNEKEILLESVIDMIHIYKPKAEQIPEFVRNYIDKYKVPGGYQESLERVARKVLDNG